MGMRKYYRAIAKERILALDMNTKHMGIGMANSFNRRLQRTNKGKKKLAKIHEMSHPLWRNVLWGVLAKKSFDAQMRKGRRLQMKKAYQ